jgi:pyruvate formate lyase activating enzyme
LVIAGMAKLSTCDWPGKLVATVFLQGCPWRCGYCHNPDLIATRQAGTLAWRDVVTFLERRTDLLDGIVLSGGEPTRQAGLGAALSQARELGFGTGLHTAGAYPRRLAEVLGLLDWVGLDIKALPTAYATVTGVPGSDKRAYQSLRLVVGSGVDHEVRITVDPLVHDGPGLEALVETVRQAGAKRIVLQEVRAEGTRPDYAAALAGRRLSDVIGSLPEWPDGVAVRAES